MNVPSNVQEDQKVFEKQIKEVKEHNSTRFWKFLGTAALCAVGGYFFAPMIGAAIGSSAGLSGAAATSYGLATLGGGSLAAGGGGMALGSAVVAGSAGIAGGTTMLAVSAPKDDAKSDTRSNDRDDNNNDGGVDDNGDDDDNDGDATSQQDMSQSRAVCSNRTATGVHAHACARMCARAHAHTARCDFVCQHSFLCRLS